MTVTLTNVSQTQMQHHLAVMHVYVLPVEHLTMRKRFGTR